MASARRRERSHGGVVTAPVPRLLFAYAGDSGVVSGLIHYVHKIVSPATYPCHMCALTDGPLGRRPAWERALAALEVESDFVHRDELIARHGPSQPPLPAIFVVRDRRLEPFVAKPEIEACEDLDALIALLQVRTRALASSDMQRRLRSE